MARIVIYMNSRDYAEQLKRESGGQLSSLRRSVPDEIVSWLNSLPGKEYEGKKIKEVVNFQLEGKRSLWECFTLVELEDR
ncbi:hypothetical protein [Pseudanabaena sp. PCC 6802]|uniref:hypothetical protein n=1 Tax=Pseudanabaena sp. PCC 6802 TaxID=118173 RepID=UPI0004776099|nr:hypothetical protein [Pseudanabaena sp. PCC 6802]